MGVVSVNNEYYIVNSDSDIVDIVDNYCGHEISQMVSTKMADIDTKKLLAKEKAKTDEESYLASLESAVTCLSDILEIAKDGIGHINNSKRINKDKISEMFNRIIQLVENEI